MKLQDVFWILLKISSLPKFSSPLFPPWRVFNNRNFQSLRKFVGLHNQSVSCFSLIFFKKNRTSWIQIIFTWFGCFESLEKRTSRKNSDVVRTLTKGRKLLHVFTCVFRLKYSRSEVGKKTPWGNFWFFGRFCTSATDIEERHVVAKNCILMVVFLNDTDTHQ